MHMRKQTNFFCFPVFLPNGSSCCVSVLHFLPQDLTVNQVVVSPTDFSAELVAVHVMKVWEARRIRVALSRQAAAAIFRHLFCHSSWLSGSGFNHSTSADGKVQQREKRGRNGGGHALWFATSKSILRMSSSFIAMKEQDLLATRDIMLVTR